MPFPLPTPAIHAVHCALRRREFEIFGALRAVFNAVREGLPADTVVECLDFDGAVNTADPSWTPPLLRDCELVYVAFDILQADGADLSVLPLLRRYEALRAAVRDAPEEGEPGFVVASGPECRKLWGASSDANSLAAAACTGTLLRPGASCVAGRIILLLPGTSCYGTALPSRVGRTLEDVQAALDEVRRD